MSYSNKFQIICNDLYTGHSNADIRKHNRAMDKILKLVETIKTETDKTYMLDLISSPEPRVRLSASVNCLRMGIYIQEATEELKRIEKSNVIFEIKWDAYMSLKLFNEGKLL